MLLAFTTAGYFKSSDCCLSSDLLDLLQYAEVVSYSIGLGCVAQIVSYRVFLPFLWVIDHHKKYDNGFFSLPPNRCLGVVIS